VKEIKDCTKQELIDLLRDAAKNWLAHDGLWFLSVEKAHSTEEAIRLDRETWKRFASVEARRIMKRLELEQGGGIPTLVRAFRFRLYALVNTQKIEEVSATRCVFKMVNCRVQDARRRKQLPDFPCKEVGLAEFSEFARTIDPRIVTRCIACPPDSGPRDYWCGWEFTLGQSSNDG
jgi:hypothetical protein